MDKFNYISYIRNRDYRRLEAIEAKQRALNDAVRRHTADVQEALFGGAPIVIESIRVPVNDNVKTTDKLRKIVRTCKQNEINEPSIKITGKKLTFTERCQRNRHLFNIHKGDVKFMEISKPKRLPLPVRQRPSRYDELRKALNLLDIGQMVEVKVNRSRVISLRSCVSTVKVDKKFAMRTLTNDGETVEMGIWRVQ